VKEILHVGKLYRNNKELGQREKEDKLFSHKNIMYDKEYLKLKTGILLL
jgi:hypothetical protein